MRQKFNIITLGVQNLERSLNFYEKGLGWKRSSAGNEHIAFFSLGGMVLALYGREALAEDATVSHKGNGFSGITIAYNAKNEKEVDEVLKEVQKLGAALVKPAQKAFWGGYSGYFKDPDGHLFEVAFNPYLEFDGNDNLVLP